MKPVLLVMLSWFSPALLLGSQSKEDGYGAVLTTWKVSLPLADFLSSSPLFPLSSKFFLSNKIQFFRADVKVSDQRI